MYHGPYIHYSNLQIYTRAIATDATNEGDDRAHRLSYVVSSTARGVAKKVIGMVDRDMYFLSFEHAN